MDFKGLKADRDLILTRHFTKGRGGREVEFVVPHYAAGDLSLEGYRSVWQTREASAHYAVDSQGRCAQLVWDRDTAWSLGDFGANQRSISIEHSNKGSVITEECRETGAHLVAALCVEYGLGRPKWGRNVRMHREFTATDCPGPLATKYRDSYIERAQYWYDEMTGKKPDGQKPAPKPEKPSKPSAVDLGDTSWTGKKMAMELQRQLGCKTVDGVISGQTAYNAEEVQQAIQVSPASERGEGSQMVAELQEFLTEKGFKAEVDGHMGRATVKALQRWLNKTLGLKLEVDGCYGNATSRAVGEALTKKLFAK